MKVKDLVRELRELNPESEIVRVVNHGDHTRIETSEERVLIKRKGPPWTEWWKALDEMEKEWRAA